MTSKPTQSTTPSKPTTPTTPTKPSKNILTPQLLQHLQYLKSLHLQAPKIGNIYLQDTALQQYTQHIIGNNKQFIQYLTQMGDKLSTKYLQASRNAQQNQPRLEQYDSYGKRIDKLHLSQGWKLQKKYAAQDGIVALAYQQDRYKLGKYQRYGQLINLYMYHPSSGLFGCPLAMTDGAAYTIKNILKDQKHTLSPDIKNILNNAFNKLTSRTDMWTSGQWMTQKKGGSDVSNTQTIAIWDQQQKYYRLYGYKWFTSATDSNISLALAKILPNNTKPTPQILKSIKVSLFYIKLHNNNNQLNNIQIIRLKDKLGTRQLPTAQLLLKGTQAYLISQPQQGIKTISKMLTITRIYNSSTAVGIIRRGLALARDYASRRIIGKVTLSQMPLQLRVLSNIQVIHRGCLILYLKLSELFSKQQYNKGINQHQSNIFRVMVPLMKLFTAKCSLYVCSQVLESFGGMGYIQGTMLPSILRDAQVLSIWQGTTNVLCYDFIRAIMKKQNNYMPIQSIIFYFMQCFQHSKQRDIDNIRIININKKIMQNYIELFKDLNNAIKNKFNGYFSQLRSYCFGLTKLFIAIQLLNYTLANLRQKDIEILERWIDLGIYKRQNYCNKMDKQLGMDLNDIGVSSSIGDVDKRGKIRSKL